MSDAIERRSVFKSVFANYYKAERDRSESCIRDIMDVLEDKDSSDSETIEAILSRIIQHYKRT
jgi:hypothetical protein